MVRGVWALKSLCGQKSPADYGYTCTLLLYLQLNIFGGSISGAAIIILTNRETKGIRDVGRWYEYLTGP